MNYDLPKLALLFGGALHFAILSASVLVPFVLDWRSELTRLHPFLRRLFWVYGGFIVLVIVSFGTITLINASALADGSPLARAFCAMIAVFWAARIAVQFFVFDARPFLTRWFFVVGYHALTVAFVMLTAIYTWAASGSMR
jgi:hypothetical protein